MNNNDSVTTLAGGAAGLGLLATVRWEVIQVPYGEATKIAIALVLMVMGYWMYRNPKPPV